MQIRNSKLECAQLECFGLFELLEPFGGQNRPEMRSEFRVRMTSDPVLFNRLVQQARTSAAVSVQQVHCWRVEWIVSKLEALNYFHNVFHKESL